MFFSAAALVKSSAAQILYLRDKERPAPTADQVAGDSYANTATESHLVEMQGCWSFESEKLPIELWFTLDEVNLKRANNVHLIEHKSVRDGGLTEENQWYFRSALIQTAFLGALASLAPNLKTAAFRASQGEYYINLSGMKATSVLNFGGQYYRVKFHQEEVIRFFLTKARASLNYKTAREFDSVYKHREWDQYFQRLIKYRKM